jgi:hypothetical protein
MRTHCSKIVVIMLASVIFSNVARAQSIPQRPSSLSEVHKPKTIVVSAQAAALVRPILDEVQKGAEPDETRLSNFLYGLIQKKGSAADEALVVLMCFYVGESQEESDAVIARGKRMLQLLDKYQSRNPEVPGRTYPASMLRGISSKDEAFEGAIKSIHHGWRSTAEKPEG